jgi:hypothetical protein
MVAVTSLFPSKPENKMPVRQGFRGRVVTALKSPAVELLCVCRACIEAPAGIRKAALNSTN